MKSPILSAAERRALEEMERGRECDDGMTPTSRAAKSGLRKLLRLADEYQRDADYRSWAADARHTAMVDAADPKQTAWRRE